MVGVGPGAREGILIKNAELLEVMEKVDTVVVEKTGTLTKGSPEGTAIETFGDWNQSDVLSMAAAVEGQSEHPLAQAVVRRAKGERLSVTDACDFDSITGGGVLAVVNGRSILIGNADLLASEGVADVDAGRSSVGKFQSERATDVFVTVDNSLAAIMAITDPIKDSTPAALKTLHELGL